ncbi:MAG TPA: glycosyltransferase family 2 protein [Puia sp.]|jgi:glycosyltransferase involved in cell wall biosynthesis|nr:glycosyltransferase family 2 protein [Puia sp.]
MGEIFELGIVIPVYNEENNIIALLNDWQKVFLTLQIQHRFFVVDDGSKDTSPALLASMSAEIPTLHILTRTNRGHGPSLLEGYKTASGARWIFQIDGDHQFETSAFPILWEKREQFDFLLAERGPEGATGFRNAISFCSRWVVNVFYGNPIKDVNSPYRLMRNDWVKEALAIIPQGSFAPNLLLSSFFIAKKARIFTTHVNHHSQTLTKKSGLSPHILKGAVLALVQTLLFRFKI